MEKFGGSQATTIGGFMSFGPPSGVTGFAQRNNNNEVAIRKRKNKLVFRCTIAEDFRKFAAPNLPIVLIR
jgi:hypothetical protein